MHFVRAILVSLTIGFTSLGFSQEVAAQTCSVGSASGSYGAVDILSGNFVNASTTFTVTCNNCFLGCTVNVCVQFNQGSPNSSSSVRYLGNGANTAQHELYSDSGYSTVWGSWGYGTTAYGTGGVSLNLSVPGLGGSASHTYTVYGRFKPNQQSTVPGTYTWTTNAPAIAYASYLFSSPNCSSAPGNTATAGSSTWTATVGANCNVSTSSVSFGTASLLTSNIDAAGSVNVTCTNATPYSVSLDNGTNVSGSQRRMRLGASSNFISYNLYVDNTRTQLWSTTTSTTNCSGGAGTCYLGTGTASQVSIPVYGRVPAQISPTVGTYSDSVVVTITF